MVFYLTLLLVCRMSTTPPVDQMSILASLPVHSQILVRMAAYVLLPSLLLYSASVRLLMRGLAAQTM